MVDLHTIPNWDKPTDGMFRIITNSWWLVDEFGNPLFYTDANLPQCNKNWSIAERLASGRDVKQLPIVYIPVRIQDYMD